MKKVILLVGIISLMNVGVPLQGASNEEGSQASCTCTGRSWMQRKKRML